MMLYMVTENPRASSGHEKRSRTAIFSMEEISDAACHNILWRRRCSFCLVVRRPKRTARNIRTETETTTGSVSAPDQSKPSGSTDPKMQTVSLTDAQANQQNVNATERKIIRNADLTLETELPSEGQRKVAAIAEARGGFVVTSDARQSQTDGESRPEIGVTVVGAFRRRSSARRSTRFEPLAAASARRRSRVRT